MKMIKDRWDATKPALSMTEEPKKDSENPDYDDDFEAQQNLLGFFSLLLEVDKRINPHLYKKQKIERGKKDDR